jgi:Protein of unknown function (DUF3102)
MPPKQKAPVVSRGASEVHIQAASWNTSDNTPIPVDLPSLAAEVRACHEAVRDHIRASFTFACRAGELLATAKKVVGHGRWLNWIDQNCDLSEDQVERYIRCAKHRAAIEANSADVRNLTITEALKSIAKPKPEPTPEPVRVQTTADVDDDGLVVPEEAGVPSQPPLEPSARDQLIAEHRADLARHAPPPPKPDSARLLGSRVQLKGEILERLRHALVAAERLDNIEHAQGVPDGERAYAAMPIADLIARLASRS